MRQAAAPGPVLRAENLSRVLEGEVAAVLVREASVEVHPGEMVAIMGPSGSGKSSLLYLLGLLDRPTTGTIWLGGEDTSGFTDDQMARIRLEKLGFVFQFHFLLPEFTALDNVMLPMRRLGRLPEDEQRERARRLLAELGLEGHEHKRPGQLSGGQRQRVAIARAQANDPLVILADEPTGALDSHSSLVVRDTLKRLATEQGRAIIAVTHEPRFAEAADRIITIVDGMVQPEGTTF
ncbi:ABC transporter ATP-binding protein [Pedomonas sp. V897]|uniref:ABC transporter ATP-binding protein n=1 Tax=Pedomonas sp. V897 TaxID=3446482 RepID=UPI003EE10F48